MSSLTIALCVILPILALVVSVWAAIRCMDKTKSGKKAFGRQLLVLAVALTVAFSCMGVAYAAEADETAVVPVNAAAESADAQVAVAAEETSADGGFAQGMSFIGAALAIGLAAIGAGIALASGAPAAIGAVAEDPKSFGKAMIFVALGEAVAIYGFIIAFLMILPTLQ